MASGYEKSYDYAGPEPFAWLSRLYAYIAPWLIGIGFRRWPRYVGNAPDLTRESLMSECREMRPGVIKTLMPEAVAALYDHISLAVLHLSLELGGGYSITLSADGSVSIRRHLRLMTKAA